MATEVTTVSRFSENARTILCKRYYDKTNSSFNDYPICNDCNERHETEDQFFERISMGNPAYRKQLLEPLYFLPNSPTLFNIGLPGDRTLSACFKFDVDDTMFDSPDSIMAVAVKAAKVLKAGGGTGYALSALRPAGALVNSTHGSALGPIGVLKIYHTLAEQITQGGKRDAAQMAILHCDHPDIEKFIHVKDEDPDALGTFNISVALTDDFMEHAGHAPNSPQHKLLRAMAQSAWKTGDPGCYFIDEAERHNPTPWAGKLTGTNPCGEVPLLRNEPCNLGSINLGKMILSDGNIDWTLLTEITKLAIRYLDDVLDVNVFPDPEIDAAARYTRKLGLGVCGFQDLLVLIGIPYDSDEAIELGRQLMKVIDTVAFNTSMELAVEKGEAPCFANQDPGPFPRNATRTCIAPTGTIAILMDASSGIEPYFALENTRTMGDGTVLTERPWPLNANRYEAPAIANDIHYEWHIKMQAAFQENTNLAVSKTINMPSSVTPEDIQAAFVLMWELKCKGGTIYRYGSRDNQVLKHIDDQPKTLVSTIDNPEVHSAFDRLLGGLREAALASLNGNSNIEPVGVLQAAPTNGWRDALPNERPAVVHKFEVGGLEGYATVGLYEDGQPAELFLDVARQGSTLDGVVDWLAQGVSVAFQIAHKHGIPFTVFTDKWIGRKFEPSGFTTNPEIPKSESLADYLGTWLRMRFAGDQASATLQSINKGEACPDCGSILEFAEGCAHCRSCGYERC